MRLKLLWSGAHRWPYGFVHFHLSFDTNVWMVIWQILHAGHSKCMYNFTCPCSYLGVSYFDVEKNYFTWDTFRCIYFSAWLLFSSTFNLQKVETVAREPRLDSFPKVHGFSMPIETLLKSWFLFGGGGLAGDFLARNWGHWGGRWIGFENS